MTSQQTSSPSPRDQIRRVLTFGDGTKVNLLFACYNVIKSAPEGDRGPLLGFLAESFDELESSREVRIEEVITEQERGDFKDLFGRTVDAMLESLIAQNKPADQFYASLWTAVDSPVFPDDKAHAFALYWIIVDPKIPYFQVKPGLKMANDEFGRRLDELRNQRVLLRFLLHREFFQRTEQADLILQVIKSASELDQPVLVAFLISEAGRRVGRERQLELLRRALDL